MRALLALPLAFVLDLRGCEESLPALPGGAPSAPTAVGPHSGALVSAGGRPVELVARTDGTLEVYGLTAGPQALGTDWIVSAQVTTAGGVQRIASLSFRPEAGRYEGSLAGGPAAPGAFRVGYLADGATFVADGALAQVLPPGPPVVAAAPPPAQEPEQAQAATTADAGAAQAGETAAVAAAEPEAATEEATPSPAEAPTPTPTPTANAAPAATPTATAAPATTATPTATAAPTPAPAATSPTSREPAAATAAPASTMRAASTGHRSSGSGFGSSRSRNRR